MKAKGIKAMMSALEKAKVLMYVEPQTSSMVRKMIIMVSGFQLNQLPTYLITGVRCGVIHSVWIQN
jgi:hypothetical protein